MPQDNIPLISVVMPVYNGAKFLHEAIDSILLQSFTDFEFIIINDGSTDKTEEIILSYNDSRIVYIKNEQNLRLIKTLNKAVDFARGRFIARMDADDISMPSRFQRQLAIFKSDNSIDIVNINAYTLSEDGKQFREQKASMTVSAEAARYLISLQNLICHPGVMVKAGLLKKYKYIDDVSREHIEDFDLWNRMLRDGCTCYTIDECLLYYRNNTTSINRTQKDKQIERMFLLCEGFLQQRFNFQFNARTLQVILEKEMPVDYAFLKKTDVELSAFIRQVNRQCSISTTALHEIVLWKKRKMLLVSLKSLKNSSASGKIGIALFLSRHAFWLADRKIRNFCQKLVHTRLQQRSGLVATSVEN